MVIRTFIHIFVFKYIYMNKGLKEKIIGLYFKGYTYNEIKKKLNCSKGTISFHLNKYKNEEKLSHQEFIKSILNEKFDSKIQFRDKYKNKLSIREFKYLSLNLFPKEDIKIDRYYYRNKRKEIKKYAVELKGGKCQICGYNKCLSALEFHHIDPTKKDFAIGQNMKSLLNDSFKEELNKCILLCSNCHREEHEKLRS